MSKKKHPLMDNFFLNIFSNGDTTFRDVPSTSCSKVKWQRRKRKWRPLERKSQKIPTTTKTTRKKITKRRQWWWRLFGTSSSSSPTFDTNPSTNSALNTRFCCQENCSHPAKQQENWKQTKFWLLHVSVQSSVGELFYSSFGTVFFFIKHTQ